MKKALGLLIFLLFFSIGYKAHASEQTFSIDSFTVKQGEEALVNVEGFLFEDGCDLSSNNRFAE